MNRHDWTCPTCGQDVDTHDPETGCRNAPAPLDSNHPKGRSMTIKTNNVPRNVIDAYELTADERAEFDYLDWPAIERGEDSASFFRYRGELYDLGEFMVWDNPANPTRGDWDGFRSDSFFSGLVVRYVDNCERIVVGLALS